MANLTSATRRRDARPPAGSWRIEARVTFLLAWPLILTNLVELALTTTNLVLVGEFGAHMLASVTLANNLFFFFAMFGLGVVTAVTPMVASELGARSDATHEIRRTVQQGLWAAMIVAVPGVACLLNAETIFRLLGQEPAVAADAAHYMMGLCWALPAFIGYIALRSAAAAMNQPRFALWAALAAIVINAVLAWGLVFGHLGLPAIGPRGPGIATAVATWSMFLLLAASLALARPFRRFRLFHRFGQPDFERLRHVFRLGLPIAVTVIFEVAVFNAAAILMGVVGQTDLAAHGIAIQVASVSFMVPLGIAQAATVRVGRAYGTRDSHAITRAGWTAFVMGVGFMTMTAALMLLAPRLLIGNFVDLDDPANSEVVARAALFLTFAGLFQIADGAQVVAAGMLRGLHDTMAPMAFAAIGYWLAGLPLGALLAFHYGFGGSGIWIGLVIGLSVVAVLLTGRWMRRDRLWPAA
jgi:MATE family multidrug resistance protein